MSGVSVAKKNGGQTSAIFANDTRWRPNSQILHRRDRSNSRVTETARPSGVPPSAARPSGVLWSGTFEEFDAMLICKLIPPIIEQIPSVYPRTYIYAGPWFTTVSTRVEFDNWIVSLCHALHMLHALGILFVFAAMHPDLSAHLHSDECNAIIAELQKCHQEVCAKVSSYPGYFRLSSIDFQWGFRKYPGWRWCGYCCGGHCILYAPISNLEASGAEFFQEKLNFLSFVHIEIVLPLEFVWLQFMWVWCECQYSVI